MTVRIARGRLKFRLWVSVRFACAVGMIAAKNALGRKGETKVTFGKAQSRAIYAALKQAKKLHGKLEILNVKTADGTEVSIKL